MAIGAALAFTCVAAGYGLRMFHEWLDLRSARRALNRLGVLDHIETAITDAIDGARAEVALKQGTGG